MTLTYPLHSAGRLIVIFSLGTWLAMAAGFIHLLIQSQAVSTYSYLLGLLSIVGISGSASYLFGKKYGRFLLVLAGVSYLVVYCVHFFVLQFICN